jgi:hypothetical protein
MKRLVIVFVFLILMIVSCVPIPHTPDLEKEKEKETLRVLNATQADAVLDNYEIFLGQGDAKEIYLAIRNNLDSDAVFLIDQNQVSSTTCMPTANETTNCCVSMQGSTCDGLSIEVEGRNSITLDKGKSTVVKLIVEASPEASIDKYRMPIRIESAGYDKTLTLMVEVKR